MKKVILAAILLFGFTAIAQQGNSRERGRQTMKDMTPEQMATLKTKKMTLALDLNEAQQSKIKALNLENAKMRKAKMEERKAQKEAGESKKPTSDERYAMANARLDQQIAQKAEMKSILSEEQFAKWKKMQHRRGKHHKGKSRRGHKGKDKEKNKQK